MPILAFRLVIDTKSEIISKPEKSLVYFDEIGDESFPKNLFIRTDIEGLVPGGHAGKYIIRSTQAPGVVKFFSKGITGVPKAKPIGNSEPLPDCEGFFYDMPYAEGMVNGSTLGPVPLVLKETLND